MLTPSLASLVSIHYLHRYSGTDLNILLCFYVSQWQTKLDLILGPSVDIPGVVDRAAWRALWTLVSRELLSEGTGLQMHDVDIHVPMNHTVERWLTYRGTGWRSRDRFFQSLPGWADDLTVLRGLRYARFGVDAERFTEFRDYTTWPFASSVLSFHERVADVQQRIVETPYPHL